MLAQRADFLLRTGGCREGGSIGILDYENSQEEAEALAERIRLLITEDGLPPSEIAVLVSRQPELYADRLMIGRGIPFRNEQQCKIFQLSQRHG
jgi:superfamily I DNA/RNA helicase